ncbi:sel1 repeat family protein [Actinoplanes sp. OR16]|uniref:SEL1-like repeat protein n=1 Tax=Actinoplanes sp. OR16 TaxID=946334 RepID=UPI000FD96F0E|nr:sel1 repeat family protein [Actinoplanes sp. OR16]
MPTRRPRALARPDLPEGSQRDVRDLLHELHDRAGRPTLEDLEKHIAGDDRLDGSPKKDVIHRIISRGGPAQLDDVRAVARTLARICGDDEFAIAARVTPSLGTSRPAAPSPRLGRPIGECDPTGPGGLEVHPAIQLPGAGTGDALTAYVPRAHDAELRAIVDGMLDDGRSRLITVVGGSSTGKTRACWELVRYLDQRQRDRWTLWHPYDPTRPEAALADLARAGSYTIVWLNEAQHYLMPADPGLGERVAAGLRTLLGDPGREPVLVLATLWPEYWNALATEPAVGRDDYLQARDLLQSSAITLTDAFSAAELAGLAAPGTDPRMRYAAAHAENGRIAQYLAGAPALEERYRTAKDTMPAARAVLQVAMDARRLGYSPALPHALLEQAAHGYLDDHDWDALGDDWFEQALAYTAKPCHGTRGPLTRIRLRPDQSPPGAQPCYRLADYLEQIGRTERNAIYPPDSLWRAFSTTVTDPDLLRRFGRLAEERGRYQHAVWLYQRAADRGSTRAMRELAFRRERGGDSDGAAALYREAAERGDNYALRQLAQGHRRDGDLAAEEALYRRAAERGNEYAARELAWLRDRADPAPDRARTLPPDGPPSPGSVAGHRDEDVERRRGEARYPRGLTGLRENHGDAAKAADRGDFHPLRELARRRERVGDIAGAEALHLQDLDRGNIRALWALAGLRERAGDTVGAEQIRRFGLTGAGEIAAGLVFEP